MSFCLNKSMKTLILYLNDDEYKQLEEKAKKEGYTLVSDYAKKVLLSPMPTQETLMNNIETEVTRKLERKIQDLLNPFTAQIVDLRKRTAEIIEKLDNMTGEENKKKEEEAQKEKSGEQKRGGRKKAIEILEEQEIVFESELKIRDPDPFFRRLELDGAKVLYLENERVAMTQKFYNDFIGKLKEIKTADPKETENKLNDKQAKLFRKLVQEAMVYYDAEKQSWNMI